MMPPRVMNSSSMRGGDSGDEADAARLFAADLDVAEGGHGNEVDLPLVVLELNVGSAVGEGLGDDRLDLGGGLARLQVELSGRNCAADTDVHQVCLSRHGAA